MGRSHIISRVGHLLRLVNQQFIFHVPVSKGQERDPLHICWTLPVQQQTACHWKTIPGKLPDDRYVFRYSIMSSAQYI